MIESILIGSLMLSSAGKPDISQTQSTESIYPTEYVISHHTKRYKADVDYPEKPRDKKLRRLRRVLRVRGNVGLASWYGKQEHGNLTASSERFNMYALTAAHNTLPFGTRVRVTNLRNNASVIVRINDRGGFNNDHRKIRQRTRNRREIDLSYAAAKQIGMLQQGVAKVRIEVLR
jgi:rare lipoprotein A